MIVENDPKIMGITTYSLERLQLKSVSVQKDFLRSSFLKFF